MSQIWEASEDPAPNAQQHISARIAKQVDTNTLWIPDQCAERVLVNCIKESTHQLSGCLSA